MSEPTTIHISLPIAVIYLTLAGVIGTIVACHIQDRNPSSGALPALSVMGGLAWPLTATIWAGVRIYRNWFAPGRLLTLHEPQR